jgi:hypothetical protein
MPTFTNTYISMRYVYGFCLGNARVASREYLHRYQDRWKVNKHVIERQSEGNWCILVASTR